MRSTDPQFLLFFCAKFTGQEKKKKKGNYNSTSPIRTSLGQNSTTRPLGTEIAINLTSNY